MALAKSQRSLKAWGKQKWRTKSGKKSSETGERYLPEKAIKAPKGFHFMKNKNSIKLMKHTGKFVAHKGASLTLKLPIQKRHGSS